MNRFPLSTPAMTTVVALSLLAGEAFAATPIEQTHPFDARGWISIENLKGRVEVRAWDRNEVRITGELGDGVEKLEVDGDRSDLRIEVKYPKGQLMGRSDRTGPTVLRVQVPLQASLGIDSVAADVHVMGVASPNLEIKTVSGSIVVAGAPGKADIDSVSGSQVLTLNANGDVSAESVSGDIALRGRLKGALDVETVSGNLQVDSRGEAVRGLSANTVSGDISARIALSGNSEVRGETVSGNFSLHMPRSLSARVEAESFSGNLKAPDAKVDKEEFGPGSSLSHRYGSGAGEIKVETFSGDFTLSLD